MLCNCSPAHNRDVGLECETLVPFLAGRVYWKGIHFLPSNFSEKQGNSLLEHVDIINAFEGIKVLKKAPDLVNITVTDGFTGLLVTELEDPLRIIDSTILRCDFEGFTVTNLGAPVVLQDVSVQNTRYGNGFVYKGIANAVDFCSVTAGNASFPLALYASGYARSANCSKVRIGATNQPSD